MIKRIKKYMELIKAYRVFQNSVRSYFFNDVGKNTHRISTNLLFELPFLTIYFFPKRIRNCQNMIKEMEGLDLEHDFVWFKPALNYLKMNNEYYR